MTKITSQKKSSRWITKNSQMLHIHERLEPIINATVDLDSLSVLPAKDVQSKSWKKLDFCCFRLELNPENMEI